ncbi:MAG: hypothetical protein HY698_01500 [Deltaproteobacteria bacterium]|nr:hypothetical protein [Deltaproteobacteria bacterium]
MPLPEWLHATASRPGIPASGVLPVPDELQLAITAPPKNTRIVPGPGRPAKDGTHSLFIRSFLPWPAPCSQRLMTF